MSRQYCIGIATEEAGVRVAGRPCHNLPAYTEALCSKHGGRSAWEIVGDWPGLSVSQLAVQFGISKQRMHQILDQRKERLAVPA